MKNTFTTSLETAKLRQRELLMSVFLNMLEMMTFLNVEQHQSLDADNLFYILGSYVQNLDLIPRQPQQCNLKVNSSLRQGDPPNIRPHNKREMYKRRNWAIEQINKMGRGNETSVCILQIGPCRCGRQNGGDWLMFGTWFDQYQLWLISLIWVRASWQVGWEEQDLFVICH